MRCDRCDAAAVIDRPYEGTHLCGDHFRASVRERFRREMHRQYPRHRGGPVAVALSGGKDSSATLALTHEYLGRRPGTRVVAVSVDEGIAGYRSPALGQARALCERLGVEHVVRSSAELLGTTTDATAARLPGTPPCGFCGVWRRRLLNDGARAAGADVLVLGFNLDDLAQTVLMNLARGEPARLLRMAPHRRRQAGLVPRIAPLARIPEREVFLFAHLEGLPFDAAECPHAGRAARNVFREVVWRLEEEVPGTRHALLRTRERLLDALETAGAGGTPGTCTRCGEPSTGTICRSCQFRDASANVEMAGARS